MSDPRAHLSALTLDGFELGSLTPSAEESARAHLAGCAECRRELETVKAARAAFMTRVFPRTLEAVQRSAHPWWRRPLAVMMVPALAASAMLVVAVGLRHTRLRGGEESLLGVKGHPTLRVFARRNGAVFQVHDGTPLAEGDQIRFVVEPGGLPYLLVVSIDGAGKANVYVPYDGSESTRLEPGTSLELPGSIVLDAAPGPERIYALFSRSPISSAPATTALRLVGAGGADAIRAAQLLGVAADAQASLVFEKLTP